MSAQESFAEWWDRHDGQPGIFAILDRWDENDAAKERDMTTTTPPTDPNPMRRDLGPGPEGKTCAGCACLMTMGRAGRCRFTPQEDLMWNHRTWWLACARYEERP